MHVKAFGWVNPRVLTRFLFRLPVCLTKRNPSSHSTVPCAAHADARGHFLEMPRKPLGGDWFSAAMCAAAGIRRSQKSPGRPARRADQMGDTEMQTGIRF